MSTLHFLSMSLCTRRLLFAVIGILLAGTWHTSSLVQAQTSKTPQVWLSDLPERDAVVGYGSFGKNGWAGFEAFPITTQGRSTYHSLGMHPNAHVEYVLDKKYRSFRATAAMNDSASPGSEHAVIFRVLADGKLLWESYGMHRKKDRQPCLLDITNVNILRLEVLYRPGGHGSQAQAHGAWIDPFVSTEPVLKTIEYLFDGSKFAASEATQEFINHLGVLFTKEDFDELEKLAQGCREKDEYGEGQPMLFWYYQSLTTAATNKTDPWGEDFARLDRWKKAKPDSVTPLIAYAKAYAKYAWAARGHGYSNEVTDNGWKLFRERLAKGRPYIDEAIAKNSGDGALYATIINYELNENSPRAKILEYFRGNKNFPRRYFPIYADLANYLLPRWHGKPGELQETAAGLRKVIGGELGDEIYFRMACVELRTLSDKFLDETDYKYEDLKPGFLVAIRDHCSCDRFINDACLLACLAGDKEMAGLLFRRIDQATVDQVTWGTVARAEYWRRKYDPLMEPAEEAQTLRDPSDKWVLTVAFAGNQQLLSASTTPAIVRWDLASGKVADTINTQGLTVREMVSDRSGRAIVVCCGRENQLLGGAAMYPLNGDPLQPLKGHTAGICNATISSDGALCGTTSVDKTARLYKVADIEHAVVLKHPEPAFDVAISPDGKQAASTCLRGGLFLWNAETGAASGKPLLGPNQGHKLCFVRFLPSGNELVLASYDGTIQVWDLAKRTNKELRTSEDEVASFALSNDGHWMALGRSGGAAEVFSVAPLALVHSYHAHHSRCQSVAFSPDNTMLATGSTDCNIKLWPISSLKLPAAK